MDWDELQKYYRGDVERGATFDNEGDPTAERFQPTPEGGLSARLAYSGLPWDAAHEIQRQRQEWQARLLRENPENMSLSVQNPDDPNFKSPAQREEEYDRFVEEWRKELGVFNK